jgi:serine protein kinase
MNEILSKISSGVSKNESINWEGSFKEYLEIVRENPKVLRNSFQRIYDMIILHGVEEYVENKVKRQRYKFFLDEKYNGKDAVFGIDESLGYLVSIFKSASRGIRTHS